MDPEVKKLLDALNSAFANFKALNDERWAKLQKGEGVDALLNMAVDRANGHVTELQGQMRDLQAKQTALETAQARTVSFEDMQTSGERIAEAREARRFLNVVGYEMGTIKDIKDVLEHVSEDQIKNYRAYKNAQAKYLRMGNLAWTRPDIANALQTGAATGGGIWVTPDLSGRMIALVYQSSPMRTLAAQQTIGTDTLVGYNDLDEASSGWVGEQDPRAETNTPNAQGQWAIPMYEQYANPKITQKMMDDTTFNVEGWLANKVARKFARTENTAFVNGNGVLKPRGFANYVPGANAPTKTAWAGVIQRQKTGVNNAFAASGPADIFIDVITSLKVEYRDGAAWTMSTRTLAALRKLKDGQGNYLFFPSFVNGVAQPPAASALPSNAGGDNEITGKISPSGQLFGYSIYEVVDLPDFDAGTAFAIYFADWDEAYQIIDHSVGVRTLRDPYTGKPYVSFYTTKRTGGDVLNFEAIKALQFSA